ncbi:uncharacterized protein LOC124172123 [Ischnura elegans]|uniref:uncharacterized protein LOC124172123 n=1 Tax=Ischnura elegans TaxID=197161 RepID=UPI001ED886E3|nr:uncharacterized protein LOC124172123 [Ischnura elegans]
MLSLLDYPLISPFAEAIYHGSEKPQSCDEYLFEFVEEMKALKKSGLFLNSKRFEVALDAYICDAPAKSFIRQTVGDTGYASCTKCTVYEDYMNNRVSFLEIDCPLRTDESFAKCEDAKHHDGLSPLLQISGTKLVSHFPLDYMHLICLG